MEVGASRQPKFAEIDSALNKAEESCTRLERELDNLQGVSEPSKEPLATSDQCFAAVYNSISARVDGIGDRIADATDRLRDMLT